MRDKKRIVVFVMAVTLSLVAVSFFSKDGEPASKPAVLVENSSSATPTRSLALSEKRAQYIEIPPLVLANLVNGQTDNFEVALFDGEVVKAVVEKRQKVGGNGAMIYAWVDGKRESRVNLSIVDQSVFGSVRFNDDGRVFKINSEPGGKYRLSEEGMTRFECEPQLPPVSTDGHGSVGSAGGKSEIATFHKHELTPTDALHELVVPRPHYEKRMLPPEKWELGIRVPGEAVQAEHFVAQINQSKRLVVAQYNGYRPPVRGLKKTTRSQTVKPLLNILTGAGEDSLRNRRLMARLPNGSIIPKSNPRGTGSRPLGTLIGHQTQSTILSQQQTAQATSLAVAAATSRPPGWTRAQQQKAWTPGQQTTAQQGTTQQGTTQQGWTRIQQQKAWTPGQQTTQQQQQGTTQQQQQGTTQQMTTQATSLAFAAATSSVTEGNSGTSAHTVTVNRSGNTSGTAGVTYATSDGTASAGTDYTAKTGTLTFAAGVTSQTISITISGDTTVENNETFNITLSNPTQTVGAASLGTNPHVVTITNDDSVPPSPTSLAFAAATSSVTEGNSGTSAHTVTVNRSGNTSGTAGVTYATSDGTASAGTDYTAKTGTLTFAAGVNSQTISITITGDTTFENNETLNITLSNPTQTVGAASLGTNPHVVTITNDDAVPPPPGPTNPNDLTVLFVYTPEASANLGGATQVQTKAMSLIQSLQSALNDSGVTGVTVKLAGCHAIPDSFSGSSAGMSTCLSTLFTSSPGGRADIQKLRNDNGADLVSCFVGPATSTTKGKAYRLTSTAGNKNTFGSSFVSDASAKTFVHEIGHNFGLMHNKDPQGYVINSTSQTGGLYPYSYGYIYGPGTDSKKVVTVMAYSADDQDRSTTPITIKWLTTPYTSPLRYCNPNITYNGMPMGTSLNDCAQSIQQVIPAIMAYY